MQFLFFLLLELLLEILPFLLSYRINTLTYFQNTKIKNRENYVITIVYILCYISFFELISIVFLFYYFSYLLVCLLPLQFFFFSSCFLFYLSFQAPVFLFYFFSLFVSLFTHLFKMF